jgi:noranthrone synthase
MMPSTRKPWITATSTKTTTISGSPRVLAQLAAEPLLKDGRRWAEIPIYVPAHNSQLFTTRDVDAILETTGQTPWSEYGVKIPFLSAVTGKLTWVRNYRDQLHLALSQCLREPIRWDLAETELPRLLKTRGGNDPVSIVPFTAVLTKSLCGALTSEGIAADIQRTPDSAPGAYSHRPDVGKDKLAIISMSGRFPEAPSTDSFWDLLYRGLDVCKEVPARRWDVKTHVDPSGKAHNKGGTRWGCWLDFAGDFDPRFFSISPKEAPQMDPAQRMALMSTYEAMERGGVMPDTTPSTQRNRIGVFHGVTSNDWMETNTAQNIDTYFITGGNRGFIPGRINFCFEFSGPSYSNDTACSSSLAAIHLACNSLWRGDCDTAVAGGTNMIFTPDGHTGLDKGYFLSRTGNCKPFDDAADGYCRAEGVGTVFIKRLEDALADRDPILGTILDIKTNHSAMSDSMTRPYTPAQIDNMSAVMSAANISPLDLSYIEMHGTGTQVGDAVEMESVLNLFAPDDAFRPTDKPLYVGSAKANIGHGEGVSGVTSLIKVLLMMKHNTIPPHCGIKPGSKINRNYPDLPARNVHIAFEPMPWPRADTPRRVLLNNFSAAGGNSAVLIEDSPIRDDGPGAVDPRTSHIVTVSGHVGKSLKTNLENLRRFLKQTQNISPARLSYTTTARRWHHLHRVNVNGGSIEEILRKVDIAIEKGEGLNRPKTKPSVVIACSGQGSQYTGMGRQLFDTYQTFRSDLERFDQLSRSHGFPRFLEVYTAQPVGNSMEDLLPVVVQLALVSLEMALGNLLKSLGLEPSAVVGHSLGEYAALYLAGVLSAADTLYLVGKRAELLQERCRCGTHAMLAVRAAPAMLAELFAGSNCEIACRNGPEDTVLSGSLEDITNLQRTVLARGIKGTLLKLPFAFHSAQVQVTLAEFENLARGVTFHKPRVPVLSPLLGKPIIDQGIVNPGYLARHSRETVDMVQALETARDQGIVSDRTITVDVGPKALLGGMVRSTLGKDSDTVLPVLSPNGDVWQSLQTLLGTLYSGGRDINWAAYHEPFESSKEVVPLPDYGWDLKDYFIPYKGEWCLHRHEIRCSCAAPGQETATSDYKLPSVGQAPEKRPPKQDETAGAYPEIPPTTTVHRVVDEKTEPLGATLITETDISRKDVNGIAQGHLVDDIPLCTPSFYADIALQVGRYSISRLRASHPGASKDHVDVSDMVIDKVLIPHGKAPQLLRTTLTMTWPPKAAATTRSAKVKFSTYFADGKLDAEHATCTVRFTGDTQLKSLQEKAPEYQSHIERLRDGLLHGQFVRYTRKSGYKLMSSMARFHPEYQLLDNLILNETDNEAVSTMDFSTAKSEGSFAAHPAYVDAITQVAGFTMNANDDTDIEKEVFVNHGWDSLQVYQPLVKGKSYQVYTRMVNGGAGDLVHGDTIVLDSDVVVAFFKGLSVSQNAVPATIHS